MRHKNTLYYEERVALSRIKNFICKYDGCEIWYFLLSKADKEDFILTYAFFNNDMPIHKRFKTSISISNNREFWENFNQEAYFLADSSKLNLLYDICGCYGGDF